ncbi:MAG TPA: methionyl-tRNA formyltransferase [Sediminispirochaeta sp.]|nr:methionyl-tRNA formyltransferase [Sediminispirochaeta sp.]
MRVLFAGTPSIAVPALERLHRDHEVVAVLSNPDRPKGRGKRLEAPPVKQRALELGLPVLQYSSLKGEARREIAALNPELLAVFAYGKIFGPKFLSIFPWGGLNVHPSLLPRYRGSIPIVATIVNGDTVGGVTVQKIALDLDTGDIILQKEIPLEAHTTTPELEEQASVIGAELLSRAITELENGTARAVRQYEAEASYCRKLSKGDGRIYWGLPSVMIDRMVRAYIPWPKAHTFWRGRRLQVFETESAVQERDGTIQPGTVVGIDREKGILVQTGRGGLYLRRLQLEGKKPMDWNEFINGNKDLVGSILGE